ncbi:MAG: hypothetical protein ACSHX6_07655 [Akkermansiaceae bacterium]
MKIALKYTILSLSFSSLVMTSCGDETSAKDKVLSELEKKPMTEETAVTLAYAKISKFVMKNLSYRMGDTPELDKLSKVSEGLEKEYEKAMYAHPDLAELVKAKNEPGIATSEGFTRLGKLLTAANEVPELQVIKAKVTTAKLATLKEIANAYEAGGKQEIADEIREILGRIEK